MSIIVEAYNRIIYGKKPKLPKSIQIELILFNKCKLRKVTTKYSNKFPITFGTDYETCNNINFHGNNYLLADVEFD